jgi:hypothetical protein
MSRAYFQVFDVLAGYSFFVPSKPPAGVMLISMARMMPICQAAYELEIFTCLYLL